MSNDVYFVAEFSGGSAARSALELAAGAQQLATESGGQAVALAYGEGAAAGAAGLGAAGAARALVMGDERRPAVTHAARAAAALREAQPVAVLAPATPDGRDLAAALVGLLGVPAFAPVRAVSISDGRLTTEQATLQGSVVTVSAADDGARQPAVVLVLPSTFAPLEGGSGNAQVSDAPDADESALGKVRIVESHVEEQAAANLEEAEMIVAGGRGVGGPEGFEMLQQLADALGNAAVGASRAAADAGWVPYQVQIGQTGKVVKPALYLAFGISGAIQHRVGMQTAQNIVAINRDPDAPIGEFADLFVVGDLFQIVPKLTDEIKRRKGM
jgi:electron transfer flavoprotein alpha subunit